MTTYFKKCSAKETSLVDGLKSVGVKNPTLAYRKKIATLNGIKNYDGDAKDNEKMLALLKKGKLIKSKTAKKLTNADKFVSILETINKMYLEYGKQFLYSFPKSEKTYKEALKRLKKGSLTGTTCVVPTRWALLEMGIDPSGFYGKNGKFTKFTTTMKKFLTKITKGKAIGKTLKQAVDGKLLKKGDILVFEGRTHTVTYTGKGYLVFDGGSAAAARGYSKVGIVLDYSEVGAYKNAKISGILRWK